jgi:hypothetical protein
LVYQRKLGAEDVANTTPPFLRGFNPSLLFLHR